VKSKIIWLFLIGGLGVSYAALTSAAESVGASNVKAAGGYVEQDRTLEQWMAQPEVRKYVERNALKKFRMQHGCLGPEAEKDAPTKKYDGKSMRCSDFLTYQDAIAKSEDLGKTCKRECLKSAAKGATGKSAAALQSCLTESCEKECDFKNISLKTELDSFIKGTIDQHGLDAASL
jgi:hypothetical protein